MTEKKTTPSPAKLRDELDSAANVAARVISDAADVAVRKIVQAAEDAKKVVVDASSVRRSNNPMNLDDHDLLIQLNTKVGVIQDDIREIKDGTSKRISDLENNKADKKDFDELCSEIHTTREDRIRKLENRTANYWISFTIYSGAIAAMIGLIIYHIFQQPVSG